jgi:hypothetical protein
MMLVPKIGWSATLSVTVDVPVEESGDGNQHRFSSSNSLANIDQVRSK